MKTIFPSEVRFDAEAHKYYLGKNRIPSVSEILHKVGLTKNYDGVDTFYRDRGIATHKAIELYLRGKLDKSSLDPAVKPCFDAFLDYWNGRMEPILALEKPMVAINKEFAGTPDLITPEAIYDWKCSKAHDRVAELQGQAYKLLSVMGLPFIVVELHDDGTFAEFNYGSDCDLWSVVMELYRWKTK